jgi:hypothetical protein
VLSIASANQELALQEQGKTVKGLELAVEAEPLFDSCFVGFLLENSHSSF